MQFAPDWPDPRSCKVTVSTEDSFFGAVCHAIYWVVADCQQTDGSRPDLHRQSIRQQLDDGDSSLFGHFCITAQTMFFVSTPLCPLESRSTLSPSLFRCSFPFSPTSTFPSFPIRFTHESSSIFGRAVAISCVTLLAFFPHLQICYLGNRPGSAKDLARRFLSFFRFSQWFLIQFFISFQTHAYYSITPCLEHHPWHHHPQWLKRYSSAQRSRILEMVMEVDEPVAATTSQNEEQAQPDGTDFEMDTSEGPIEPDETLEPVEQIQWKFNQVKGNIDADVHTEGNYHWIVVVTRVPRTLSYSRRHLLCRIFTWWWVPCHWRQRRTSCDFPTRSKCECYENLLRGEVKKESTGKCPKRVLKPRYHINQNNHQAFFSESISKFQGKYVKGVRSREYNVYSTFQSHEPEFDYLKSLEIDEKINQIRWLKKKNAANFILSTNDKTIKLWKISERERKIGDDAWNLPRTNRIKWVSELERNQLVFPIFSTSSFRGRLQIPSIVPMELIVEASPRRVYGNAHTYHVNSISVNSDQETFLSADDLRVNLWNLEITNESFSEFWTFWTFLILSIQDIVDIKPANMEELTEVITAAEFHPTQCNWFVYSSSKGSIRLCDMRDRALCDAYAKSEF